MAEFNQLQSPQDTVFDVDAERLARVYAEAALDAVGDLPAQELLVSGLSSLVEDVLDRQPQLEEMFASELISKDEKLAMLDRMFSGRASTELLNVLKVVAKHGRLGLLRDITRSARDLLQKRAGRIAVDVETAAPIDDAMQQEILAKLQQVLGGDPIVSARVNPDLIAGFVIRAGDRVFDASVRTSLEHTRHAMVARAVEAIQTRPKQFIAAES